MANSSMIQVAGRTYRIERKRDTHDVFRLCDDLYVGSFAEHPTLHVVCSIRPAVEILQIARSALRAARLPFSIKPASVKTLRRARMLRILSELVVALWPAA